MKLIPTLAIVGLVLASTACSSKKIVTTSQQAQDEIRFRFDSHQVGNKYQSTLTKRINHLIQNPNAVVLVEGHTDIIGDNDYNMDLGDKRARSVKSYLLSQGVKPTQIITISYGESVPSSDKIIASTKLDRRVLIGAVE